MTSLLHRICWECYHYYFGGTAAAKVIQDDGTTELTEPKRCHFCGGLTKSVMEMYRHPSEVLARDCADIHEEEAPPKTAPENFLSQTREIPVVGEESPYPGAGDIAFDEAGRVMEWTAEGGWEYPVTACEHEKTIKELQTQLDFANNCLVEMARERAIAERNLIRPHGVLADIFGGVVVIGERAREFGTATLVYTLPTGTVAVCLRLPDIDLLEGLEQVERLDEAYPTEPASFEAMAQMATCPRRVVYGSADELRDIDEAFQNYELANGATA